MMHMNACYITLFFSGHLQIKKKKKSPLQEPSAVYWCISSMSQLMTYFMDAIHLKINDQQMIHASFIISVYSCDISYLDF